VLTFRLTLTPSCHDSPRCLPQHTSTRTTHHWPHWHGHNGPHVCQTPLPSLLEAVCFLPSTSLLSSNHIHSIHICDIPQKFDALKRDFIGASSCTPHRLLPLTTWSALSLHTAPTDVPNITMLPDSHAVSCSSDFIIYSVKAEFIDHIVVQYHPCMYFISFLYHPPNCFNTSSKLSTIVMGQTSIKAPEKAAFEKYLPTDVHIVLCQSLICSKRRSEHSTHSYRLNWMSLEVYTGTSRCKVDKHILINIYHACWSQSKQNL